MPGNNDPETSSNSNGSYVLENIPQAVHVVRAEVRDENNLRYYGQNVIQVFEGERSRSTNVTVYRDNQLAAIRGTVRDRFGNLVSGAKVFAIGTLGFSSNISITGDNGEYVLGGLLAGVTYDIAASAPFHGNDEDTVNLLVGEERTVNFALGNTTDPLLPAPQNLRGTIWTSPREVTRGRELYALEAVKRLVDPNRRPQNQSRLSIGGNWIEVDLLWDPVPSQQLLGYGIYRGTSALGTLPAEDFLRDIYIDAYTDLDDTLSEGPTYYYEVTALNTEYPDTTNSESNPSNRVGFTALGDMELLPELQGPLTFRWNAARNASTYVVYVFDAYPAIGLTPLWQSAPTALTSQVYAGPALTTGNTYYYIVVGSANANMSHTVSVVDSFIAN
jgi:hypothetical protein